MLPRLEAERELGSINVMTIAMGGASGQDRDRYVARLERLARGGKRPPRATPETLAAMGIAVVEVPAEEPADG